MTEFRSISAALPPIPDDLSVPQFILDHPSPLRTTRPTDTPWLINDHTGRAVHHAEVRLCPHLNLNLTPVSQIAQRTRSLANALSIKWNISPSTPLHFSHASSHPFLQRRMTSVRNLQKRKI